MTCFPEIVLSIVHGIKALPNVSNDLTWIIIITTFEIAIIAFLIPLSIDIISKISDRYNSNVIIRSYENYWLNKFLPVILIFHICSTVFLSILLEYKDKFLWKCFAWTIILTFFFICLSVLKIVRRIKKYISNSESIVENLTREAKDVLKKS